MLDQKMALKSSSSNVEGPHVHALVVLVLSLPIMSFFGLCVMFCICAGDVVFSVDLHQNDKAPFYGPCDMTLNEDCITVQRRGKLATPSHQLATPSHQRQIQWSITHLKKFWVKSDVRQLVLLVGRWALRFLVSYV